MNSYRNRLDKKQRIDIMFDIEALALSQDATILQLSAISFDLNSNIPKMLEEFNMFVDVNSVNKLVWSNESIRFWTQTEKNKQVLHDIILKGNTSEDTVIKSFYNWLNKYVLNYGINNVYLWSNGMLFDTVLIENKFKEYNLENPIIYKNKLDVRTVVKTVVSIKQITETSLIGKAMTLNKSINGKQSIHNALNDCKFQICLLKICFNELNHW